MIPINRRCSLVAPVLGLVCVAAAEPRQAETDAAWTSAKADFLRLSRQEHNARITEWQEVAAWTFDDNRMPGGFAALAGQWKVEEGRLRAIGGEPMSNRIIKLGNCVWPAFKIEFDARLDSGDPSHVDKICDIILGLNCAPDTGSFAKGYALLAAHYYNQATTLYRLNIPCARVEWSPVEPGRTHRFKVEVVKPHIRLWIDDRIALDYWERAGRNNRDGGDFLEMNPDQIMTLSTYDSLLTLDNMRICIPVGAAVTGKLPAEGVKR
jgi:hypothetical protein